MRPPRAHAQSVRVAAEHRCGRSGVSWILSEFNLRCLGCSRRQARYGKLCPPGPHSELAYTFSRIGEAIAADEHRMAVAATFVEPEHAVELLATDFGFIAYGQAPSEAEMTAPLQPLPFKPYYSLTFCRTRVRREAAGIMA
jgi:hypothetical protein